MSFEAPLPEAKITRCEKKPWGPEVDVNLGGKIFTVRQHKGKYTVVSSLGRGTPIFDELPPYAIRAIEKAFETLH